jgi:hypothetical protein
MSWLPVILIIDSSMLVLDGKVQRLMRVLQDALEHNFYVPEGKFYLVGAGYANTPNFIAPYRNVRYHLQEQA